MPTLISNADGSPLMYYTLTGALDFKQSLEWYVKQGAIDVDVPLQETYMDNYDGYTLSLFNMGMTNLLE